MSRIITADGTMVEDDDYGYECESCHSCWPLTKLTRRVNGRCETHDQSIHSIQPKDCSDCWARVCDACAATCAGDDVCVFPEYHGEQATKETWKGICYLFNALYGSIEALRAELLDRTPHPGDYRPRR